ncbi:MAG: hypothetical protein ACRET7_14780, partial [Burkholderiales bacterium]
PRYLWLHNPRQAEILEAARRLAPGEASIIPPEVPTFEKWRQYVYRVLRGAGVSRATDQTFHDLRRYAERRIMPSASRGWRLLGAGTRFSA